jgi:hypothetical protein
MSFKSALSSVGHVLKQIFTVGVKVAVAAEPLVAFFFPGSAALFVSIATAVGQTEANAIAAGVQDGTGPQKLAMVVAAIEKDVRLYEAANAITTPHTQEQIEALANAVVAFLNNLQPAAQ